MPTVVRAEPLADRGVDHDGVAGAEEEDARVPGGEEPVVGVAAQRAPLDHQRAGPVVAHVEDRPAALPGVVAGDDRALDPEVVGVAVVVDGPAAATAWGSRAG